MIGDTTNLPRRLRKAAGDWLAGLAQWRWYCTLTFEDYVTQRQAMGALKRWARIVAQTQVRDHFMLAFALEKTTLAGVWHIHVLLDAPEATATDYRGFMPLVAAEVWKRRCFAGGFTRIESFQPDGRAPYYLTKTASYDCGVICPRRSRCRRSVGCRGGPSPWR